METDLVCGMEVDPTHASLETEFEGRTFYFCSEECMGRFERAPQDYLANRVEA
jgi:Cu+-exporting ATPase